MWISVNETGSEDLISKGSKQADVQFGQIDVDTFKAFGIVYFKSIDEFCSENPLKMLEVKR